MEESDTRRIVLSAPRSNHARFAAWCVMVAFAFPTTDAFVVRRLGARPERSDPASRHTRSPSVNPQRLYASTTNQQRRETLLARNGPHFKLDRRSGTIEFGATANLVTQLDTSLLNDNKQQPSNNAVTSTLVNDWLLDERGMALSIWDPKLMQEKGNHIYRLQIMTLQFVTLTLAPWVDVQMKTVVDETTSVPDPVFTVQSVAFDPNIQILPGMRLDAKALGIVIEVVGTLRAGVGTTQNSIVSGGIAFQTTGTLPPPMRLLPESLLKATSDSINQTIVNFAIQSFQTGARANFREFVLKRQREQAAAAAATSATAP